MKTQTPLHYNYNGKQVFLADSDLMPNVNPIATDDFVGAYLVEDYDKFEGDLPCEARGAVEGDGTEDIVIAEVLNDENEQCTEYRFCTKGEALYNEIIMEYSLVPSGYRWGSNNKADNALEDLKVWEQRGVSEHDDAKILREQAARYADMVADKMEKLKALDIHLYHALEYDEEHKGFCPTYDAIAMHHYCEKFEAYLEENLLAEDEEE